MRTFSALVLLLLAGCDEFQLERHHTDPGTMAAVARHEIRIAELEGEIRRLKAEDEFLAKQDSTLAKHIDGNAEIANKNGKIDDSRWEWMKAHVHN